jgi:hypothetical protein
VFIYSSCGKWVFPLSCGVFLPLPLSQAFLLLVAGCTPPTPAFSGQARLFIYSSVGDSPPPLRCSGCPTLFAMCLYCSYCLLLSFSFFPEWGLVCPRGCADLAQGCLWKYCVTLSSPVVHVFPSHLGVASGSPVALLVSPFNVKWRCSVQYGGVEGQRFASSRWSCLQGVSPASL